MASDGMDKMDKMDSANFIKEEKYIKK